MVYAVERFINKHALQIEDCNLACLYVIDSICRYSKTKFGEKDKYCQRFDTNLETTFSSLCKGRISSERTLSSFSKTISLWEQHQIFSSTKIAALRKHLPSNLEQGQTPQTTQDNQSNAVHDSTLTATPNLSVNPQQNYNSFLTSQIAALIPQGSMQNPLGYLHNPMQQDFMQLLQQQVQQVQQVQQQSLHQQIQPPANKTSSSVLDFNYDDDDDEERVRKLRDRNDGKREDPQPEADDNSNFTSKPSTSPPTQDLIQLYSQLTQNPNYGQQQNSFQSAQQIAQQYAQTLNQQYSTQAAQQQQFQDQSAQYPYQNSYQQGQNLQKGKIANSLLSCFLCSLSRTN